MPKSAPVREGSRGGVTNRITWSSSARNTGRRATNARTHGATHRNSIVPPASAPRISSERTCVTRIQMRGYEQNHWQQRKESLVGARQPQERTAPLTETQPKLEYTVDQRAAKSVLKRSAPARIQLAPDKEPRRVSATHGEIWHDGTSERGTTERSHGRGGQIGSAGDTYQRRAWATLGALSV